MNVLITGGAGFIGSNFVHYMLEHYPTYHLVNVDNMTYAGNINNIRGIDSERYTLIQGDVCDRVLMNKVIQEHEIEVIVHLAAESHVDRSIADPAVFVKTNVLGTQVLLDLAKAHHVQRYIQVSTDEVYGTLGATGHFTEETPLAPNSPYAASKAGADMIVRAYGQTFGMHVNITRCSNNYGPHQFPEKLIPLLITKAMRNEPLPLYGDGLQVRDWLHVYDHCVALDLVLHQGQPGEVYNIGGQNERTNVEIAEQIVQLIGASTSLITYVADRPGHDRRYAIDATKMMTTLGWSPQYDFEQGLASTVEWYKSQHM